MRVRDAVEADAAAIGSMADRPRDVVRNMIHDRSVRVGVTDDAAPPADADAGEDTAVSAVAGFVAFDVRDGTVHVTNFEGTDDAVERLFEEPVGFATREGMTVEAVIPDDRTTPEVVEPMGFEAVGSGPRIDGASTTRYRFDPEKSG